MRISKNNTSYHIHRSISTYVYDVPYGYRNNNTRTVFFVRYCSSSATKNIMVQLSFGTFVEPMNLIKMKGMVCTFFIVRYDIIPDEPNRFSLDRNAKHHTSLSPNIENTGLT